MKVCCPTCQVVVEPPPQNTTFPFCSERCRSIDLGRWLGEEFRLHSQNSDDDEDGDEREIPVRREDA
jgi:uncharacterized protein